MEIAHFELCGAEVVAQVGHEVIDNWSVKKVTCFVVMIGVQNSANCIVRVTATVQQV
jgi:hypothetical protein